MPRLYLTSAELKESVLGFSMAGSIGALSAAALDKLLFRASERVDGFCKKRIQCIGSTTISGFSTVLAGSTSLPVVSTLTFDNKDEQAVTIGSGSNKETILIQSGGVTVTSDTSPYPGTLTLDTPTQFDHNLGEAVVGIYKEVTEAGGVSSGDSFSQSILTQQAQIAQAHQPAINLRNLTRVIWLRNSPIISISGIEHAYSFLNFYQSITGNVTIPNPHDGWYRFETGIVITPDGLMRTTYLGGYLTVPDDVKQATMYYASDLLQQFINPGMAIETRQGKVAFKYATGQRAKSPNVEAAEDVLKSGKYVRKYKDMGVGSLPLDENHQPVLGLKDDVSGNVYPVHIGSLVTGSDGKTYAVMDVSATLSAASNQRVNTHAGDIVSGSVLAGALADGASTTFGAEADAAAAADTTTATFMSLFRRFLAKFPVIGPQAKAASVSVTFATDNPKAGVSAAASDFADGAVVGIGTTTQTKATDATTTSWSVIQILKGIFNSLLIAQLVSRSTVAVYSLASVATSGSTQNSGDLTVGPYTEVSIDINTTAQSGTSPTIQYFYERKAADGLYYILWQSAVLTAATNTLSTSIGAGMAYNQSLGVTGRLRWVVGGSATPTFTHTANIQGK